MYINDISDGLQCNPKLFVDDISLLPTVHNINKATNGLNNNLVKITKWAFQWKMSFFLIGIHSMQGLTATTRHGVTRKEAQKR